MNFKDKKVVVVGEGVSGQGAMKALVIKEAKCSYYDNKDNFNPHTDLIVVSPGIPPAHEIFTLAKDHKIKVISEIELGFLFATKPIIAVTGTNGKTTVTELIGQMLAYDQRNPLVCGNIGRAFSSAVLTDHDIVVLEVSSFQLERIDRFQPHVALITNISPDHLDRHKTMTKYAQAKLRICKNQKEEDYLILPKDGIEKKYWKGVSPQAKMRYASLTEQTEGCYMLGQSIYYEGKLIGLKSDIAMQGAHNVMNALMAATACKLLGVRDSAIRLAWKLFRPDAYRIQFVDTIHDCRYYNDSKGTNIGACLSACRSMKGSVSLIVGGSGKGYGFEELFIDLPQQVEHVIAMGETAAKIQQAAVKTGFERLETAQSLNEAVQLAAAHQTKNVLLSPAAASFDRYTSYKERGKDFNNIVGELKNIERSKTV